MVVRPNENRSYHHFHHWVTRAPILVTGCGDIAAVKIYHVRISSLPSPRSTYQSCRSNGFVYPRTYILNSAFGLKSVGVLESAQGVAAFARCHPQLSLVFPISKFGPRPFVNCVVNLNDGFHIGGVGVPTFSLHRIVKHLLRWVNPLFLAPTLFLVLVLGRKFCFGMELTLLVFDRTTWFCLVFFFW